MANNVISAVFSSSNITYTKPAYQYDYGMILKFSGIELPQAYEVHFSNTEFCGNSITQIGGVDGVTIPDEMFLNGNPIYAWTYLHTGADDGETVYKAVISINKRAKPSNKTPTPVQQDAITQAIAALNTAVEQTAQDVVDATAAKDAAELAQGKAEDAQEAAEIAQGKAEDAQEAAETAQGKAEDAQQAAEAAAGSVLGLTADATIDNNVGTPSVEVEVTTESDHKNMSFSFRNLKGVQGDPGDQGIGISSVILNPDYTLTITLTNGTSYTTTSIRGEVGATPNLTIGTVSTLPEGSQATATITGTDEEPVLNLGIPVGATGATGNGIASIAKTGTVGLVDTYTITYTDGTTSAFEVTNGADGEVSEEELTEKLADKADVITSNASGEIVTIADGGNDMPVVDLKLSLLPVQSGSGDPSPDNVRPISGWTGITIWDDPVYGGNIDWNQLAIRIDDWSKVRISITVDNNVVTFQPTSASSIKYARVNVPINHKYLVRGILDKDLSNYGCTVGMYDPSESNSYNNRVVMNYDESDVKFSIILQSTSRYYAIGVYLATAATTSNVSSIRNFQIFDLTRIFGAGNEPQTESEFNALFSQDYYPYNPGEITTVSKLNGDPYGEYPIDWTDEAGTVYGGSLDLTTGVLTVDHKMRKVGDLTWNYINGVFRCTSTVENRTSLCCCDTYATTTSNPINAPDLSISFASKYWSSSYNMFIKDSRYTSSSSFKTAQADVEIVFHSSSPNTYQLTPEQINTFLGVNNFWMNANGTLDLEYRADTKLYIQNLTKPTEDDMTANQNITASSFFMVGNRLFLSTVAIAQGSTIIPGTNCTEISLADALNSLNS